MNSIPNNNYTTPNDTNHPLPFTPRPLEPQYIEAPTYFNDLFSNDLLDFGDFDANAGVVPTPQVPPHDTLPRQVNHLVRRRRLANIRRRGHIRPGAISRVSLSRSAGFDAPPRADILPPQLTIDRFDSACALNTLPSPPVAAGPSSAIFDRGFPRYHVGPGAFFPPVSPQSNGFPQSHAAVAPQLTMDVCDGFDPVTLPSTSHPSGSSSAIFDNMTSELVPAMEPAHTSSSSLPWMTRTPELVVHPWDARAAPLGPAAAFAAAASTASVRAESRQVPASRCACCRRVHPLVRVNDAVEWVRPDVMRMVLYFNWSQNAEAEAHESWEPRGA